MSTADGPLEPAQCTTRRLAVSTIGCPRCEAPWVPHRSHPRAGGRARLMLLCRCGLGLRLVARGGQIELEPFEWNGQEDVA